MPTTALTNEQIAQHAQKLAKSLRKFEESCYWNPTAAKMVNMDKVQDTIKHLDDTKLFLRKQQ